MNNLKDILAMKDFIKSGNKLVFFFTKWCGECKMISDYLIGNASKNISQINVDENDLWNSKDDLKIEYVPTLRFYVDGKLEKEITNITSISLVKEALDEFNI